jgi:hypothetical protein
VRYVKRRRREKTKPQASFFAAQSLALPQPTAQPLSHFYQTKLAVGRLATRPSQVLPFAAHPVSAAGPIASNIATKPFNMRILMRIKAKNAKKRPKFGLPDDPAGLRRQHTPFTRDIVTLPDASVVTRLRTRTILTPLALRLAIMEDAALKPEAVRARSLRRRLTPLDRALTGREAEMLERLTSCINGLSNVACVDFLKPVVRGNAPGRLPFGERKRQEISAMAYVLKGLNPADKSAVLELAVLLDPSTSLQSFKPGEAFIAAVCQAAKAVVSLYSAWPEGRPEA